MHGYHGYDSNWTRINEHGGPTHIEGCLTLRVDSWPNENLQSLMWVLENDFLRNCSLYKNNVDICNNTNDILIPSLMCYHTCYLGTIIDSFNTTL
jgi:hypothetical protein